MRIIIKFIDGSERIFEHENRPAASHNRAQSSGSYTNRVKFENGFCIVTTVWDVKHSFPASTIKEVIETFISWQE